jgi:RHS repeat-associated protein
MFAPKYLQRSLGARTNTRRHPRAKGFARLPLLSRPGCALTVAVAPRLRAQHLRAERLLENRIVVRCAPRYYSPVTGTFVSQDPSGFGAGDLNLRRYVGNDPTDATDPTGMQSENSAYCGSEASSESQSDCGGHSESETSPNDPADSLGAQIRQSNGAGSGLQTMNREEAIELGEIVRRYNTLLRGWIFGGSSPGAARDAGRGAQNLGVRHPRGDSRNASARLRRAGELPTQSTDRSRLELGRATGTA